MNGTPRLRSAFPNTPRSNRKYEGSQNGAAEGTQSGASFPSAMPTKPTQSSSDEPLIPLSVLDAPTQRLYISAFYLGLTAWRLYDYFRLVSDQTDSLWLFMKWVAIDGVFLYGLPGLRIPWLEWSSFTMTVFFLLHAVLNGLLMFRISIPGMLGTWLLSLTKVVYDRGELAVSERRVIPASIVHNSSLILGKQIIHILPEGSAMLNPDQGPLCIDESKPSIDLPISINQTNPILIELLRIDLETNDNETITLSSKEARKLKRQADKDYGKKDSTNPRLLRFPIKKTGLYRLQKVVDESKLEVQRKISDTLVVQCPSASMKAVPSNKCKGALSDFFLAVDATPPLKVKYSKTVNRDDAGVVVLSILPETLVSPLAQQRTLGALITLTAGQDLDISWARTQHIEIPINETLGTSGGWGYFIEEVHDACGNVANYSRPEDHRPSRLKDKTQTEQIFAVHERPRASLKGRGPENPLKVAKGRSARLPISFGSMGSRGIDGQGVHVSYLFTPQDQITPAGEHAYNAQIKNVSLENTDRGPEVQEPGLYTLYSVSTEFCNGDILEPSSCLLLNPPEPDLEIHSENIPDKCAGNSIGLLVDLDLIGTPPFRVYYTIQRTGGRIDTRVETIDTFRTQLELKPKEAGHYIYEFLHIGDELHQLHSLRSKHLRLEQDVKPAASARFIDPYQEACIEESTSFDVRLSGERPWILEYELVHGVTRQKFRTEPITTIYYSLETPILMDGDLHSLSLTSVTDNTGCKVSLEEEAKIRVRHYRPKAQFGWLEGKRSILTLEAKKVNLPLRLRGESPWVITYRKLNDPVEVSSTKVLHYTNDVLEASTQDTYEITSVKDASCPGTVEPSANQFEVLWISRPTLRVAESSSIEFQGKKYVKKAVCEGDQDALEISLTGSPPYFVKYNVHLTPERGSASVSSKELNAGLGSASVRMETTQAGQCEYRFVELGDHIYDHDRRKFSPVSVQQKVYGRPSARFDNIGKTYGYCKEEEIGDEVIPITLTGEPPFSLEIGIRHHATTKPEIINIPHVESRQYNFQIPHRVLNLGTHGVTIRKVRDSHGCQRETEYDGPIVYVNVADQPSIAPLESTTDYCVGDRISYVLSGTPPFSVFYTFGGVDRKAAAPTTNFRRIAESPGNFTITAVSDRASTEVCKARTKITKMIHELPSVRISKGRVAEVDIHEGGDAEILFEFGGTPPFEFTYTRSTNAAKGKKSVVLETKNEVSHEHSKTIRASEEGTYEVVSIRDRFCGFSTQKVQGKSGQKLLTFR